MATSSTEQDICGNTCIYVALEKNLPSDSAMSFKPVSSKYMYIFCIQEYLHSLLWVGAMFYLHDLSDILIKSYLT